MTILKPFTLAILLAATAASAQKLPNVQKESIFAPADIKIDGKATEWHDQFKAHNSATDVYYTLANDNENLYLIIRAKYKEVEEKIIHGGITLSINHALGKKDPTAVSVTFPVMRDNDVNLVANMVTRKFYPQINGDTSSVIKVDDLNQLMDSKSKQINTTGIKSIVDNTISVYNSEGLKAAERFDDKLQYTCELAIPLKYLSLSGSQPFSYHITVNEPAPQGPPHPVNGRMPPPGPPMAVTSLAATDFWGEYQLAVK